MMASRSTGRAPSPVAAGTGLTASRRADPHPSTGVRAPEPGPGAMRCACRRCGAHTIASVGFRIGGNCHNCGSYELTPVPEA